MFILALNAMAYMGHIVILQSSSTWPNHGCLQSCWHLNYLSDTLISTATTSSLCTFPGGILGSATLCSLDGAFLDQSNDTLLDILDAAPLDRLNATPLGRQTVTVYRL